MIKGIIFDLDGVLVDSESIHYEAYRRALHEYGHFLTIEDFDRHIRSRGKKKGLSSFLGNVSYLDEIGHSKDRYFMSILQEKPPIFFEDALELLDRLQACKYRIAVATASGKGMELLEIYNKKHIFDVIVTGRDVINNKPSPEIYNLCIRRMNLSANEVIVIEDSMTGMKAASDAGLNVICIRCEEKTEDAVRIEDLRQVTDILERDSL